MTDGLDQIRERIAQTRNVTRDETAARVRSAQESAAARTGALSAGTRVFDVVTGLEGHVEPAAPGAAPTSRAIFVRLVTGALIARPLDQLVVRPTPPAE